jgi:hypothetical protein
MYVFLFSPAQGCRETSKNIEYIPHVQSAIYNGIKRGGGRQEARWDGGGRQKARWDGGGRQEASWDDVRDGQSQFAIPMLDSGFSPCLGMHVLQTHTDTHRIP